MIETRAPSGLASRLLAAALALLALAAANDTRAQEVPAPLDERALEELVAPVALYPDDLLAIVLPASTYPLQVVEAARLLEEREANPDLELAPDPAWDDSIVALLNYPEALELLNDDLDWTWQLGEAVLAQQGDVLEAVEVFRDQAWLAGNLRTDDYQTVTRSDEGIEIRPAAPDVVYVPYYDPVVVVRRSSWPVYNYHPHAYPLYYYPYPVGHRFYSGWFWGVSTAFAISWRDHYLHLHYYDNVRHPYYGRRYISNRYYRHRRAFDHRVYRNGARVVHRQGQAYRWHPRRGHGARPGYRRYGARNDTTIAYTDRSARRGRTERAARVNRERQRYRTYDNVIDRERRGARRDRDRDRSGDAGAGGSRTQRFAANGRDRSRDGNRSTARDRDRDATARTPRTQRFASNGSSRNRADSTQRRRNANGGPGRTQRFATGSNNRNPRADTPNRERRAGASERRARPAPTRSRDAAPRRQADPRAGNARRDTSRAQRPASRPESRRSAPRAERRSASRPARSAPKRSASRERSRSDGRRRRD